MTHFQKDDTQIITTKGWLELTNLFDQALLLKLSDELNQHEINDEMKMASIGHNDTKAISSLRGDSTLWLDDPRCGAASKSFLDALDVLRKELNESLMLGLESVEAHFSIYPSGAAYARHHDRFRDDDARILSLVCYLNIDWPDNAGGALRLHLPAGKYDISPNIGTSIVFLSEEIEHEVMPATQTRYSIAAWFRQREMQLR
jgi:SM-20-related protein